MPAPLQSGFGGKALLPSERCLAGLLRNKQGGMSRTSVSPGQVTSPYFTCCLIHIYWNENERARSNHWLIEGVTQQPSRSPEKENTINFPVRCFNNVCSRLCSYVCVCPVIWIFFFSNVEMFLISHSIPDRFNHSVRISCVEMGLWSYAV